MLLLGAQSPALVQYCRYQVSKFKEGVHAACEVVSPSGLAMFACLMLQRLSHHHPAAAGGQRCNSITDQFLLLLALLCSIGATTMEQLQEDIDAFENVELDEETLAAIDAIHLQASRGNCCRRRHCRCLCSRGPRCFCIAAAALAPVPPQMQQHGFVAGVARHVACLAAVGPWLLLLECSRSCMSATACAALPSRRSATPT